MPADLFCAKIRDLVLQFCHQVLRLDGFSLFDGGGEGHAGEFLGTEPAAALLVIKQHGDHGTRNHGFRSVGGVRATEIGAEPTRVCLDSCGWKG